MLTGEQFNKKYNGVTFYKLIDDNLKTYNLCKLAVRNNRNAFEFVPDWYRTDELISLFKGHTSTFAMGFIQEVGLLCFAYLLLFLMLYTKDESNTNV